MYDLAGRITAVEMGAGIFFSFKLLDSPILVHHLSAPDRDEFRRSLIVLLGCLYF